MCVARSRAADEVEESVEREYDRFNHGVCVWLLGAENEEKCSGPNKNAQCVCVPVVKSLEGGGDRLHSLLHSIASAEYS